MSNLCKRPIYQKGQAAPPKSSRPMRNVAKGKKASSDCPIMRSARGEQCLADWCDCGGSTETTCVRHVRKFGIGGMGIKPPNWLGFYGCQRAEDMFALHDQWSWEGLFRAVSLTQMKLRAKGLLPN